MLKEIPANLHCGWGGRQLQIIKLSLRYVHGKLGDVLCDMLIVAMNAFFFPVVETVGFHITLCVTFMFCWD